MGPMIQMVNHMTKRKECFWCIVSNSFEDQDVNSRDEESSFHPSIQIH